MKKKYTFENGKYVIIRDDTTYAIQAFRGGEIWEAAEKNLVGDKLFHSALNRIDELEEINKKYLEFTLGVLKT